MDARLKDREVLCLLDTRQIQRYMFRSNIMLETLGASELINHIQEDAIRWALAQIDPPLPEGSWNVCTDPDAEIPYFTDEKIIFQLLTCAAGNTMFAARTGEVAQKIVRKVSRYYLEHAYSLNLAAAIVEKTGEYSRDIFNLYRALDVSKASSDIQEPMGTLPVVRRERKTGLPVAGYDRYTGEPVSRESMIRRREAARGRTVVLLERIRTTRAFDGHDYRAVIHADGNNLGITISRITQRMNDYESAVRFRRRMNREIEENFRRITEKTAEELEEYWHRSFGREEDFSPEFQIVHRAGDDINIICNANLAFPFLQFFYRNLRETYIWKDEKLEVPLNCCAGVAFVRKDCDFHTAFSLAEECCANAKKEAKKEANLRNGLAGNWLDFQILDSPHSQELDMYRQRVYMTGEQVSLLLRPYCLDPEVRDEPYAGRTLINRIRALRQDPLTPVQRQVMHQSFMLGTVRFGTWCLHLYKERPGLLRKLGSPLWRDRENRKHATWFDAEELLDFVSPGEEE